MSSTSCVVGSDGGGLSDWPALHLGEHWRVGSDWRGACLAGKGEHWQTAGELGEETDLWVNN